MGRKGIGVPTSLLSNFMFTLLLYVSNSLPHVFPFGIYEGILSQIVFMNPFGSFSISNKSYVKGKYFCQN